MTLHNATGEPPGAKDLEKEVKRRADIDCAGGTAVADRARLRSVKTVPGTMQFESARQRQSRLARISRAMPEQAPAKPEASATAHTPRGGSPMSVRRGYWL
jgi:hypothetical protein